VAARAHTSALFKGTCEVMDTRAPDKEGELSLPEVREDEAANKHRGDDVGGSWSSRLNCRLSRSNKSGSTVPLARGTSTMTKPRGKHREVAEIVADRDAARLGVAEHICKLRSADNPSVIMARETEQEEGRQRTLFSALHRVDKHLTFNTSLTMRHPRADPDHSIRTLSRRRSSFIYQLLAVQNC
jgi:hypothetical protein